MTTVSLTKIVELRSEHHSPDWAKARCFVLNAIDGDQAHVVELMGGQPTGDPLVFPARDLRWYDTEHPNVVKLISLVRAGYCNKIEDMLNADPLLDPNGSNECSLISCLGWGNPAACVKTIQTLIKHGADINHQAFADEHGPAWTPLWNAVHDNNLAHVKRLIDMGSRLDLPVPPLYYDQKNSLFYLAADCERYEIFGWLLDQPNVPAPDSLGLRRHMIQKLGHSDPEQYVRSVVDDAVRIPLLHWLALHQFGDDVMGARFLRWVIDTGDDITARDHLGNTALDLAKKAGTSAARIMATLAAEYAADEIRSALGDVSRVRVIKM